MLLGLPIDRTRRKVTPRMQFIPVNLLGPKGGMAKDKHHSWRQKIICAFTLIKVPGPFYCDCNGQTALLEISGLLEPCVELAICMVLDRLYHLSKPVSSSEKEENNC